MWIIPSLLLVATPMLAQGRHMPHDSGHSVAVRLLSTGETEIVAASGPTLRAQVSTDDGISWTPLQGNGLETTTIFSVVWLGAPANLYLFATENGVWAWDPNQTQTVRFENGLPTASTWASVTAPDPSSNGPAVLVGEDGTVWTLDRTTLGWTPALTAGISDIQAVAAIAPHFDFYQSAGPAQTIWVASGGVMNTSSDGGATWIPHSQFNTAAVAPGDWRISALAFADDWNTSGNALVGRWRQTKSSTTQEEGEIWVTNDGGQTFSLSLSEDSSFLTLVGAPPNRSGSTSFFAAVSEYPWLGTTALAPGVLRSDDGGLTWNDFGNAQDFIGRYAAGDTVGDNIDFRQEIRPSPNFSSDDCLFYYRAEGFYVSKDAGYSWSRRSARPATQVRSIDTLLDQNGNPLVFCGRYGAGVIRFDLNNGNYVCFDDSPIGYVDEVAVSPSFLTDGFLLEGGEKDITAWFDPAFSTSGFYGWKLPRKSGAGYVRTIEFSPNFSFSGGGASEDKTFFLAPTPSDSQPTSSNLRTRDGGFSFQSMDKRIGSLEPAPNMSSIKVAPTYNDLSAASRTDVYGVFAFELFRSQDKSWRPIWTSQSKMNGIAIPSNFDRDPNTPATPSIFVICREDPKIVEYIDSPSGATVKEYGSGLEDVQVTAIALPPDFGDAPAIFAATFCSGVLKLDLTNVSSGWQSVGGSFLPRISIAIACSPSFTQDQKILVGTLEGLLVGEDRPGTPWTLFTAPTLIDNTHPSIIQYSPLDSRNPQPLRPWRWDTMDRKSLEGKDMEVLDKNIAVTEINGAWLQFFTETSRVDCRVYSGPNVGALAIEIRDYFTGQLVAATRQELRRHHIGTEDISLSFPHGIVEVRATADLNYGQIMGFDGFRVYP